MLINAILNIDDLEIRLHFRSLMEKAGLQRIVELVHNFNTPVLDKQLKLLALLLDEAEQHLRERVDQDILRDINDPQDLFNAIYAQTQDTKARDHFSSMMQHLLLIREEGEVMVKYYQLIDSMVTDVVMDKKLEKAEQRFGHSVERIISQFNEAEKYRELETETAEVRATLAKLKLEKEALEGELSVGEEGRVRQLKAQIAILEEKLAISRDNFSRLEGQLRTQKAEYESRIEQLEAQIMELFRMLKEVGKGVISILDEGQVMDRKTLVDQLERDFQRRKTISILEGRDAKFRRGKKVGGDGDGEGDEDVEEDDVEATPGKAGSRRTRAGGSKKKNAGVTITDETGRVSQFMDADDADAQEQIQQQMAAGAGIVCLVRFYRFETD